MNTVPAPQSSGRLEKLVHQYVKERGLAEKRVRDWVSYMALAGALERAAEQDRAEPQFTVRGGVAMELRLEGKSRATRDIDLTIPGPARIWLRPWKTGSGSATGRSHYGAQASRMR